MPDDFITVPVRTPGDPRDWETLRAAAIRDVARVFADFELDPDPELPGAVTGAILSIFDEEALNRLGEHLVNETRLKSMDFRNGMTMDLEPARVVATWAAAARTMLGSAPNYTETRMEFGNAGEAERYAFVVQRAGKPTPHEMRRRAEAERDQLAAHLGADHAALVKLGKIIRVLDKTTDSAIQILERVHMDTEAGRDLHAQAITALREARDKARAAAHETAADMAARDGTDASEADGDG